MKINPKERRLVRPGSDPVLNALNLKKRERGGWNNRRFLKLPETVRTLTGSLKGAFDPDTVGDFVGISRSSVGRIWAEEDLTTPRVEIVKRNMAAKFYLRSAAALDLLTPDKLAKLNGYQLILTAGIALDKARLIEGLSTENVNFKSLAVTISAELSALREQKQALMKSLEGGEGDLL